MRKLFTVGWFACLLSNAAVQADIRIATVGPLTGPRAWSGEQFRRGAEMAVADINANGGVLGQRVALIVGDDAQDPSQAVAVAEKLVGDGIVFVAGHRSSDASIAAAPVYADAGVIQISPSSTSPEFTELGYDTVFRVCGRDDRQGAVAGTYLAEHHADGNIAIVHDGSTYGKGLATQTRTTLNRQGVQEIWYDSYEAGRADHSDLIARIESDRIDVIYVGGYSTDAALLLRQARERGLSVQLVAGDALHNSDFWAITGSAGEGARSTFDEDPRENPAAADVVTRFREQGYEPEGYTLHTYAAVQVWAEAVGRAATVDSTAVSAALHAHEFDTVLGEISFDSRGDITSHRYVWYVWRGGRYVRE
jgi:branched-chain amino acid transport system substrate-binding protein